MKIHLKRVYLDGWLSYDKTELLLDFPGITSINGKIGSGKSAILEAIFYLLFGKTLRGKDSVNSLVNKILQKGYEIQLDFYIDAILYSIKEIRGRDNHGLYFWAAGETEKQRCGKTDPETRKAILNTLHMSAIDFSSIAFLGQRQTQLLIDGTPGERASTLVDIFGLNRYDELLDACESEVKEVLSDKEDLSQKCAQYENDMKSLEEALSTNAENGSPNEIPDEDKLLQIDEKITGYEEKLEKIRAATNKLNKSIGKTRSLISQAQKCSALENKVEQLKKELKQLVMPEKDKDLLDEELTAKQNLESKLSEKIDSILREIDKINKLGNKCPINKEDCPVNIPSEYKETQLDDLGSNKAKFEKEIKVLDSEVFGISKELKEAEKYESVKKSLEINTTNLNNVKVTEEIPDIMEEEKKLDACKETELEVTERLKKLHEKKEEIIAIKAKIKEREESYKRIKETLKARKSEIKSIKDTVEKMSIDGQYLSGALAVFKKAKMYKIDMVLQVLNENMEEILNEISDGELKAVFESQKKDSKGKKTLDKVTMNVIDSYKEIAVELCSGGQSSLVGVACLLAVWKTANKISDKSVSSLFLDEVFGSLHEDMVDKVFNAIVNTTKSLGTKSVYIISHQALDSKLFDRNINIESVNGISQLEIA